MHHGNELHLLTPAAVAQPVCLDMFVVGHWMAGFWPGVLWQLHALTGKPIWAEKAQLWQKNLAGKQRAYTTQHDWGECAPVLSYMPLCFLILPQHSQAGRGHHGAKCMCGIFIPAAVQLVSGICALLECA